MRLGNASNAVTGRGSAAEAYIFPHKKLRCLSWTAVHCSGFSFQQCLHPTSQEERGLCRISGEEAEQKAREESQKSQDSVTVIRAEDISAA